MSLFVELIQVTLGTRTVLSRTPSDNDWQQIYDTAAKQSLVGIVLSGIEELRAKNAELSVPRVLLLCTLPCCVRTTSLDHAHKLLIGTNKYFDWTNPELVVPSYPHCFWSRTIL